MLLRVPLALVSSMVISLLTSVLSYYDGAVTLLLGPIFAVCCGGATTILAFAVGSFLLIPKVWAVWRRYWPLSILLFLAGIVVYVMAFDSAYMINIEHPEFPGQTLDVPDPTMSFIGWFGMVIGIMYFPLLGFSTDKKWY